MYTWVKAQEAAGAEKQKQSAQGPERETAYVR